MNTFRGVLRRDPARAVSPCLRLFAGFLVVVSLVCLTSLSGHCGTAAKENTKSPATDQQATAPSKDQNMATQQEVKPWEKLHPERVRYAFISLFFTAIPLAAAVLLLMYFLRSGTAQDVFSPYFGQGQLGQFVVIILIAGNVCTLAIAGILDASEVSAIYGGIVGYVLGKKA